MSSSKTHHFSKFENLSQNKPFASLFLRATKHRSKIFSSQMALNFKAFRTNKRAVVSLGENFFPGAKITMGHKFDFGRNL
jgi:hypothetical protein